MKSPRSVSEKKPGHDVSHNDYDNDLEHLRCLSPDHQPKLGDFRKLYRKRCLDYLKTPAEVVHDAPSQLKFARQTPSSSVGGKVIQLRPYEIGVPRLGDFRRIQPQLNSVVGRPGDVSDQEKQLEPPAETPSVDQLNHLRNGHSLTQSKQTEQEEKIESPIYDLCALTSHKSKFVEQTKTATATISRSISSGGDDRGATIGARCGQVTLLAPPQGKTPKSSVNVGVILSYQRTRNEPIFSVLDFKRSVDKQHESLLLQLIPLRLRDVELAAENERLNSHGVHVFLDMSNINISFQHALRARYLIGEASRFMPLPHLNLQFLTEILVRDRKIMALNAGCSVIPCRQEPRYVGQLRQLGYRVDLRERKRVSELTRRNFSDLKRGSASSSDELATGHYVTRYLEDLVDETLQTRIAESVMEYFQRQGTLVIATGDAQPAKYSDGFFTYAERALRMGWHVEVVSWKASLSSNWRKSGWAHEWGQRFRIIELDDYLNLLLT